MAWSGACVGAEEKASQADKEPQISDQEYGETLHLKQREHLIPEGAYSPKWLEAWEKKEQAEIEKESVDDPFAVQAPANPVPVPRARTLRDHFGSVGATFPPGSMIKRKTDPNSRYDRLVVRCADETHELIEAAIDDQCGPQLMAEIRLRRQIELVKSLRDDPRNMKNLDYSELELTPMIAYLAKATFRAVCDLPVFKAAARPRSDVWAAAQRIMASEPDNPRVIRLAAIETALADEIDSHLRKLLDQQKRLAALRKKLDAISKLPYESDDPFANCR